MRSSSAGCDALPVDVRSTLSPGWARRDADVVAQQAHLAAQGRLPALRHGQSRLCPQPGAGLPTCTRPRLTCVPSDRPAASSTSSRAPLPAVVEPGLQPVLARAACPAAPPAATLRYPPLAPPSASVRVEPPAGRVVPVRPLAPAAVDQADEGAQVGPGRQGLPVDGQRRRSRRDRARPSGASPSRRIWLPRLACTRRASAGRGGPGVRWVR